MATANPNRRVLGIILVVLAAVILLVVIGWRLIGIVKPTPQDTISVKFTPANGPVETAAPVHVDATVDLEQGDTSGPQFAPTVDMQLRDAAGQPAPNGDGPTEPLPMHVGGTLTGWILDISAPTTPGQYHVHLFIRNAGRPDFEVDLPQPALAVVPAVPYTGGLVYERNNTLWRTDPNGQHTHRLTFYGGDSRAQDPAWSPDGSLIAFARALPAQASELPHTEIWALNPNGGPSTQLAARQDGEDLVAPAFGPDGTLYFASDRLVMPKTGATPSINELQDATESWSIDSLKPPVPTGTRQQMLPNARAVDLSRDGKEMVYVGVQPSGAESEVPVTHTLWIATPDGKNPRVLVADGVFQDILAPRISPDGTQVAFAGINATGVPGGSLNLWQALGLAPRPALANGVPWDIYLVPTAGGQPARLTNLNADQPFPAWSRDGKRLAVLTERALYILDVAHPEPLPAPIGPGSSHGQLAWYDP